MTKTTRRQLKRYLFLYFPTDSDGITKTNWYLIDLFFAELQVMQAWKKVWEEKGSATKLFTLSFAAWE